MNLPPMPVPRIAWGSLEKGLFLEEGLAVAGDCPLAPLGNYELRATCAAVIPFSSLVGQISNPV